MGVFLSTVIGVKNIKVDLQNTLGIKTVFGGLRIAIAIVSGIVIYFLIQANILLGFIKDTSNPSLLYVAFFLSGFSERLIYNLMIEIQGRIKLVKAPVEEEDGE